MRVAADELRALWGGGRCALSGRLLELDTAHLDHILPKSRGGGHTIDNLQWLDPEVNKAKRAMTDEEFRLICHEVAMHMITMYTYPTL